MAGGRSVVSLGAGTAQACIKCGMACTLRGCDVMTSSVGQPDARCRAKESQCRETLFAALEQCIHSVFITARVGLVVALCRK